MPDVFLSYSRDDQPTARRFAEALQREGFEVWWDQSLSAGQAFDRVTERALEEARAVVVLWSKRSVDSNWVRAEAAQAHANQRLVPVMIEPCKRPIMFELTHTAELSDWKGEPGDPRWRTFVDGLRRSVGASATASATTAASIASAAPTTNSPHRRLMTWSAVAAVLLALAAGLGWNFRGSDSGNAIAGRQVGIAVLPFDDLSAENNQQHFADGIAEEILNQLAHVGPDQLRVIARNSSFAFRGGNRDLKQVGEMLGVDHVLEGSVRKSGDQLRITVQLINAKTDAHLWSRTYERPFTDIFAIQDEIARSVAEALQISLGVGIGRSPGMTSNVEAYEAFLEAGQPGQGQLDPQSVRQSIELLQRAVAEDPAFAQAWFELYADYSVSAVVSPGADQASLRSRSEAAFNEARRLQPDLPGVLAALANQSVGARRWTEAMSRVEDYEAAAKKYRVPDTLKADLFVRVGRIREALPLLEEMKARDPLNPSRSIALIGAYSATGNKAAAYSELGRVYGTGEGPPPTGSRFAALTLAMDMRDETLLKRAIEDGIVSDARLNVRFYADIKQRLGDAQALKSYMRALITPQQGAPGLIGATWFLAYLGEPEAAMEAVQILTKRGIGYGNYWTPLYAPMRRLPAFRQYVSDTGLVDYWKQYGWGDFCTPVAGSDDFECR